MKNEADQINDLLKLSKHLNVSDFEHYIDYYLEPKADKGLAIQELDRIIGELQNHISSFSLYLKQNYLLRQIKKDYPRREDLFYTKQEVAIRYRVSIRTVSNWTYSGLQVTEIGGVKRISEQAVKEFVERNKTKKFHWKSIAR
jgi:hypothetical protein